MEKQRKSKMSKECVSFLNKIRHPDFQFEQPLFYNNEFALRCELGIGRKNEYEKNAYSRAVEIFKIVFEGKPDLYFFDKYIYDNSEFGVDKQYIDNIVNAYKTQLEGLALLLAHGYEITKDIKIGIDDYENGAIRRNRYLVFCGKKNIDFEKLIEWQLTKETHIVHYVSLDNECIFSIYDHRGLDIVFTSKEKGKPFFEKLKPYLLEHDIEKMSKIFN